MPVCEESLWPHTRREIPVIRHAVTQSGEGARLLGWSHMSDISWRPSNTNVWDCVPLIPIHCHRRVRVRHSARVPWAPGNANTSNTAIMKLLGGILKPVIAGSRLRTPGLRSHSDHRYHTKERFYWTWSQDLNNDITKNYSYHSCMALQDKFRITN